MGFNAKHQFKHSMQILFEQYRIQRYQSVCPKITCIAQGKETLLKADECRTRNNSKCEYTVSTYISDFVSNT